MTATDFDPNQRAFLMSPESRYQHLLACILAEGEEYCDRTGVGRKSIVCPEHISYSAIDGFPLFTTKKVFFKAIAAELLWFLSGSTNNNDLRALGATIWDEWQRPDGELGPVYGYQWRNFNGQGIDQISNVIEEIKNNPFSSRLIVSAWNPAQIKDMALPPCHSFFQFFVREANLLERMESVRVNSLGVFDAVELEKIDNLFNKVSFDEKVRLLDNLGAPTQRLDMVMYQRSCDMFLGVPFNVASYALLMHMVAAQTNKAPGTFHHYMGDAHLYQNQYAQAAEQIERIPQFLPELRLARVKSIFDYKMDDIKIEGYKSYPAIKADVAV